MSLLTGQPRSANVVAEEETEVLQIKKNALKPIFETNPDLVKLICEIVEQRRELSMNQLRPPRPTKNQRTFFIRSENFSA
jgi:CRP-like cAMP-binding protein